MTTTTAATPGAGEYVMCDPGSLLIDPDANIRTGAQADKDLIASVKDLGVIEPVIAWRADGKIHVRHGARRVLAAAEAGVQVPVIIHDDGRALSLREAAASKDEADRIVSQFAENEHRAPLTQHDRVAAVAALFELQVPAATIARRLRLKKADVTAAQQVAAVPVAKDALGAYDLTISQAAALAELSAGPDGDSTVTALLELAGRGQPIDHAIQQFADQAAEKAAIAELTAQLQADGKNVLAEPASWSHDQRLYHWADPGKPGRPYDDDTHAACPGHTAVVSKPYYSANPTVTWICADPKGNGHRRLTGSGRPEPSPEEKSAERKHVLAGNKNWRAARTVRRRWLAEFLGRPKPPADAVRFLCQEIVIGDSELRAGMDSHALARELLGLPEPGTERHDLPGFGYGWRHKDIIFGTFGDATPNRQIMTALACVLCAHEDAISDMTWRNKAVYEWQSPQAVRESVLRYLAQIVSWGYELSEAETEYVTSAPHRHDEPGDDGADDDVLAGEEASGE